MGTPLEPNEPGASCGNCWGIGKDFGDEPTPQVIQLRLTSLLPGDYWDEEFEQFLLTTHYLEQTASPCHYQIESSGFRFVVIFLSSQTVVQVVHLPTARQVFDNTIAPKCALDIANNLTTGVGVIMYNGFANVTWDKEGL